MTEIGMRDLVAGELTRVAGGYTLTSAGFNASVEAGFNGGTYDSNTFIYLGDPPDGWQMMDDGGDAGQGGYSIWFNPNIGLGGTYAVGQDYPPAYYDS